MIEPRTITRDAYLKALGLFTIGNDYYVKGRDFEMLALQVLGFEDDYGGHVSDIFNDKGIGPREFDEALKKCNISVEDQ